jgi:hypothetical protein
MRGMIMTNNTSAALNKKFGDTFTLTDNYGNSHLFVRNWSRKGFFEIAKCEINTDGHIDDNDGLVPGAVLYTNEEVADLITESEERARRLENIESLLEEWINIRRSRSRKAKQKPRQLQKQEVSK